MRNIQINFFLCSLDDHLIFQPHFFIFLQKTFHTFRTLFLPGSKRRCNISNFKVSKFQQMPGHDTSQFRIIQFYRINIHFFILIIHNRYGNLLSKLLHQIHKAMTGIKRINNAQRTHLPHHLKISFLHFQITLRITHKQSKSLLFRTGLYPLKKHHIIRIGEIRAENHQQLLLARSLSYLPFRRKISQIFCRLFHLFHSFL